MYEEEDAFMKNKMGLTLNKNKNEKVKINGHYCKKKQLFMSSSLFFLSANYEGKKDLVCFIKNSISKQPFKKQYSIKFLLFRSKTH